MPLVLQPKCSTSVFSVFCDVNYLDRKASLLYIQSVPRFSTPLLMSGKCLLCVRWMLAVAMFSAHPETLVLIDLGTRKGRKFLHRAEYYPESGLFIFKLQRWSLSFCLHRVTDCPPSCSPSFHSSGINSYPPCVGTQGTLCASASLGRRLWFTRFDQSPTSSLDWTWLTTKCTCYESFSCRDANKCFPYTGFDRLNKGQFWVQPLELMCLFIFLTGYRCQTHDWPQSSHTIVNSDLGDDS